VIPQAWDGFTATRVFRGVTYRITAQRQGTGNSVALTVDGAAIEGDIVPPPQGRTEVTIVATVS
jgi:cellobiose phosphorylase